MTANTRISLRDQLKRIPFMDTDTYLLNHACSQGLGRLLRHAEGNQYEETPSAFLSRTTADR